MFQKIFIFLVLASSTMAQIATLFCVLEVVDERCSCNLMILNPDGFNNLTIIYNSIENCTLNDVVDVHGQGSTTNVPTALCSQMPNMENLDLKNLGIKNLLGNPFRNCHKLKSLKMSHNKIDQIPPYAFSNTELEVLHLDDNQLSQIDSTALDNLLNLKVLNISSNVNFVLGNLPDDVFDQLTNLTALFMSSCGINALKSRWFEKLENLSILDLSSNAFNAIPVSAFDYLLSLTWLDLSSGELAVVTDRMLRNNTNLLILNLQNNKISSILSKLLINQEKLSALYLTNNVNLIVPSDVFLSTTSLQILEMNNCNFTEIMADWFSTLQNVQRIDLGNNQIPSVPVNAFSKVKSLQSINLSNNKLESLDSMSFGSLQNLLELNVADNEITQVDHFLMAQSSSLLKLNFENNTCANFATDNFGLNRTSYMDKLKECFNAFDTNEIVLTTVNSTLYNWFSIRSEDGWEAIEVSVKAYENVHIALTNSSNGEEPPIEIQIGQNRNRVSNILYQGTVVFKDQIRNRLNESEFRNFIIGWRFGIVMVFREGDQFPFMAYQKENPFTVNFFGLRTLFEEDEELKAEWRVKRMQVSSSIAMMKIYQDIEIRMMNKIPINLRRYLQ